MDREVTDFSCGNASIDQQIRESYFATLLKQAYGYRIELQGKTVGYYMLYFKNINLQTMNNIMGDEYDGGLINYYMAVHIRY